MAKKLVKHEQQDVIRKDGGEAYVLDDDAPVHYEIDLPEDTQVVSGGASVSTVTIGADDYALWGFDCIALDSEGKPRVLVAQDTPMQSASVLLPRAVLIALLDPTHELADTDTAEKLRLIERSEPTPIGKLIIAGTDQTALRHKMAAAWRAQHNAELDRG